MRTLAFGDLVRALTLLLATAVALAADVRVQGLFPDRALLNVDGQQKLLRVGETFSGVKLLSANSESATVEIDGKRQQLRVGQDMHTSVTAATTRNAQIARGQGGHYLTVASINGQTVDALIDTGASSVAMSQPQAERLGIAYRTAGRQSMVSTASGTARAWSVQLNKVRIGEIERSNIEAVVIEGNSPSEVLIGMSFLRSLQMRDENNVLHLQANY